MANGEPLAGGRIEFHPTTPSTRSARAVIAADGRFQLRTFSEGDGAALGVHKVKVFPEIPEEALDDATMVARYKAAVDPRYQSLETTPLEYTVTDDEAKNRFDIVIEPPRRGRR